ncbi:dTDP-4-amino-4,6-dideoxygalactose transaminase [Shewanella sp. GutCb]|uniref:dTDP-4-amino-4,6-dideoxygalactose transaminase n=1 Tax=Shewanella sp. GutCb TaxID=2058315 RepID=UPI000C7CA038|nr:dTDP-4-amino-4,6-dideoxygalactose transaminase [Shewanella sp. GutCb]PKG75873.1 dTDP-4-amino-4,6-dideoxygalactose transaminase [Shewanella sp. GutCb]
MIPFNKPPVTGKELKYIEQAMNSNKLCGDGFFGLSCQKWFEEKFSANKTLLTPSCTHALELAALLIDIKPGDEVIMPSYTFVSSANPFVLRGAKIVFVDIRPDTMNIDEKLIESAITSKTIAIVPVHYAGVACEMDYIMDVASRHNLVVIEDAAQGVNSYYKGKALGTIGHFGAYSFHETKNYSSGGEGGLLLINDTKYKERAEIVREKGTNRSLFFRGMVDKYSWVDVGSSYLPSEIQAAYLWAQLEHFDEINEKRLEIWDKYHKAFKKLKDSGCIDLPIIPNNCTHNAHMFYLKLGNFEERQKLINHLKKNEILAVFHYIPLHSSDGGKCFSSMAGEDRYTTEHSEKLLRLPLFYNMKDTEVDKVISCVLSFFASSI